MALAASNRERDTAWAMSRESVKAFRARLRGVERDPNLTLTHEALKIFTAIYVLTGIGILVELARQLGVGFIKMREEGSAGRHTGRDKGDRPPETQSAG